MFELHKPISQMSRPELIDLALLYRKVSNGLFGLYRDLKHSEVGVVFRGKQSDFLDAFHRNHPRYPLELLHEQAQDLDEAFRALLGALASK
jgi:hypothetical protein